jgi:hypothetical protein
VPDFYHKPHSDLPNDFELTMLPNVAHDGRFLSPSPVATPYPMTDERPYPDTHRRPTTPYVSLLESVHNIVLS